MTGRRQAWTGLALSAFSIGLRILAVGVHPLAVDVAGPFAALQATMLITSVLLIALCSARLALVLPVSGPRGPVSSALAFASPTLIRLYDPDAAGRPRPRAPGMRACRASLPLG